VPYKTLAARTKTGVVADAIPTIAVPPSATDVLGYPSMKLDANAQAKGWSYYLAFFAADGSEVTTASATVTPWVRDDRDASWASVQTDAAVAHRELYQCAHFFGACDLFFQLTDIAGAGVASVEVRLGSF
jgi:amino acid permease